MLEGGTDEDIFAWRQERGRELSADDIAVWNSFATKRGWRDDATTAQEKYKAESDLAHRSDLLTYFDTHEADEGRTP